MAVSKKRLLVVGAVIAVAAAGAGGAYALVSDDDTNVTGPEADQATAAALVVTGGGTANSVERDSEDGAVWEVEVTKPDGTTVDVRLDAAYGLVVVEGDTEEEDGDD